MGCFAGGECRGLIAIGIVIGLVVYRDSEFRVVCLHMFCQVGEIKFLFNPEFFVTVIIPVCGSPTLTLALRAGLFSLRMSMTFLCILIGNSAL